MLHAEMGVEIQGPIDGGRLILGCGVHAAIEGASLQTWGEFEVVRRSRAFQPSGTYPIVVLAFGYGLSNSMPTLVGYDEIADVMMKWVQGTEWHRVPKPEGDGSSSKGFIFRAGRHHDQAFGYDRNTGMMSIEPTYNYFGK